MRILYVTRTDPYIRGGGSQATKAFIKSLTHLFPDSIDLILADSCQIDPSQLPVKCFSVPTRNLVSRSISILSGKLHRYQKYLIDFLTDRKDHYDLCIFNGSLIAGDMVDFVNSVGIQTITIHHNYEKEFYTDNKRIESFWGLFPHYIIKNERNAYLKSSMNLFLTNQDMQTLSKAYGPTRAMNLYLGVFEPETLYLKSELQNFEAEIKLVISGTLSSVQTIKGIKEFHIKYLRIVKELDPNIKIILTGRNPSTPILRIVDKSSEVYSLVQNPKDIEHIIKQGHVYLCPISIGGGIKLRIMDGIRAGLPVLVHSISSRGYDVFFGQPWFRIYSDELSFKEGLMDIINGIKNKEWSALTIQQEYLKHFSFESGVARLKYCMSYLK